jgi:serine/threonine protein kinase
MLMGDAAEFLSGYQRTLETEVAKVELPPQLFELFQFESCLKHKDGKEVYLVIDRRTGGRAILRSTAVDAGDKADAEYQILYRLDYPGIPKTFGSFIADKRSYIVREYFVGHPLDAVIAQGVMSAEQIFPLARSLCAILGYLHAQTPPVIHRDIKPQNIILLPNGAVGLTDFGIARTFKPGSDSDTQYVGTLPYAPPEQYGYAQSTGQTDIYALGIVLIYLATGSPNRQNLTAKITDKRLLDLIQKCIAFDPANRFRTVGQIVNWIDHPPRERKRFAAYAVAAVLALALVAGGVFSTIKLLGGLPLS